jgi:hypothetical protein
VVQELAVLPLLERREVILYLAHLLLSVVVVAVVTAKTELDNLVGQVVAVVVVYRAELLPARARRDRDLLAELVRHQIGQAAAAAALAELVKILTQLEAAKAEQVVTQFFITLPGKNVPTVEAVEAVAVTEHIMVVEQPELEEAKVAEELAVKVVIRLTLLEMLELLIPAAAVAEIEM